MESDKIIELSQVCFQYPGAKSPTLKISQLDIFKKEKVFLYGPSGSGKSTLLEVLSGILQPQQGEVKILGENLVKMTSHQRDRFRANHLGYIFQSFNLIPYLSVEENITLPLVLSPSRRSKLTSADVSAEVERLCQHLGLGDLKSRGVTQLSVGQQQRVAVARALLGNPELILADEPTSSLDHDHRERFIRLLFEECEARGTTVLFVSHDRSLEKIFTRSLSFNEINQGGAE
ncbi:MAG: methionine ABC transporter ATP-binding protein [Bdellovibrio sp. CG10_big_fil_rev_8_21_14_0_10_47_8]|nr:MAG: methionine ABC transporter ATP-binding protein [Bdellovibrio sp. CG10_big_fil_rev_8_21_14_0_10_47_8]